MRLNSEVPGTSLSESGDGGIFRNGETTETLLSCTDSFYGAFARTFPPKAVIDVFKARDLPGQEFNAKAYDAFCALSIAGQFSLEEMMELNAILATGTVSVNDLVEMYGSMKVQALMELRSRKSHGTEPRLEHVCARFRKMLDGVAKAQTPDTQAVPTRIRAAFSRCRQLATSYPALFDSLFARVYREVEIFDQRSETAAVAGAAVSPEAPSESV